MAKILITDDDVGLRSALRLTVERQQHVVAEAKNGREAIEWLRRDQFDLVFLDLLMPEQDGIETLTAMREMRQPPKIIMMSDGGNLGLGLCLPTARGFGVKHFLRKPFSLRELLEVMNAVLADGGPQTQGS
ncbi:MAG: response regulator [Opitutae bacterium]|nr:response regulator [Opitutae bacterium]